MFGLGLPKPGEIRFYKLHSAITRDVTCVVRTIGRDVVEEFDIVSMTWIPYRNMGTMGSFDDRTRLGLVKRVSPDEATMLMVVLKGERERKLASGEWVAFPPK
jgi:hypothetical protein